MRLNQRNYPIIFKPTCPNKAEDLHSAHFPKADSLDGIPEQLFPILSKKFKKVVGYRAKNFIFK